MTTVESPAGTTTPLKGIRKVAARRMVEAWAIPVFHLTVEVDMTHALGTRERAPGATVRIMPSAVASSEMIRIDAPP